jgi:hypothetical protein
MKAGVSRFASVITTASVLAFTFLIQASASPPATVLIAPNHANLLDCNGFSPVYTSIKPTMRGLCADPFFREGQRVERAYDNGHYIGHDEPSVKFISGAPGSGNHMTYYMQLATDPTKKPTPSGSVTTYAELSIAPWYGLPMCDPRSYPQNPCTASSDTNTGLGNPGDAGSAFMELQFYAPGFGPFKEAYSCDQTQWCAALTIDSLSCTFNFQSCNNNCFEPVNFAYLQLDGVPAGPPSPQLSDDTTLSPNAKTLRMNGGDKLKVVIQDTTHGLRTTVMDLTTGQAGFMVASATNGFMNTDLITCAGTPFDFHAEYSTASKQNQVPWAALEGGVLMQQEIGHFETCSSVSNPIGLPFDAAASWTCNGGLEPKDKGEGPCTSTGCTNARAEANKPCPSGAQLCEFSDALCFPAGPRTVMVNGSPETWTWPVAACNQNFTQNGDLDFDGNDYHPDWPDGSASHPTSFKYAGPFDPLGNPYPSIQFETDLGGSELFCNVLTGAGCTVPPAKAKFYPFYSIGTQSPLGGTNCLWNFGNTIAGVTTNNFGGVAEFGAPDAARYAGTFASAVLPNPQLTAGCTG